MHSVLGPCLRTAAVLAAAFLGFSAAIAAGATGTITGRVSYAVSGEFLELARVTLEGTGREAFTDSAGGYAFAEVPAGEARLRVFYTGLPPESATVTVTAVTSLMSA